MTTHAPPPHEIRLLTVEGASDAVHVLEELGCDPGGVRIMSRKTQYAVVSVSGVQARAAHIVKQVMLSKGGECATPREIFSRDTEPVRVVIMGTPSQISAAIRNLSTQPFGLKRLSAQLKVFMEHNFPRRSAERAVEGGGVSLPLGERTLVMGVVNVTPDSFSDGGVNLDHADARRRALEMQRFGADVVDVGGESTRPGAEPVPLEEEIRRTAPLIESLAEDLEIPVSIDTWKAEVARRALDAGAGIINDITALRGDPEMIPLAAERGVPVIIMHMQGTPRDMQDDPAYDDVVAEICAFLSERAEAAVAGGVERSRIMVDPGIGFGKTVRHNLEIIRRLPEFRSLGYPVVLGTSRKRFIGSVLDRPVGERLLGTAATVAFAIARGVDMVRVHDVEEMVQVVRMADAARAGLEYGA